MQDKAHGQVDDFSAALSMQAEDEPPRMRRAARSMRRRSPGLVRTGGDKVTSVKPARRRAVASRSHFCAM
jgi:hypothetical protein